MSPPEWKAIETAPTEGGTYLVGGWVFDGGPDEAYNWDASVAWRQSDGWYCDVDDYGDSMPVTIEHVVAWMEIPPPPPWAAPPESEPPQWYREIRGCTGKQGETT